MNRTLNIGCGNDTNGTDFLDLYPQRKEVIKCDFESDFFPFEDNTFDKVICNFVFEHLKNRTHLLKEIYRILKTGGIIELRTDNASYWYYALDNTTHTGRYEKASLYGECDKHYSLFTDHHLRNFMEDVGFKEIEIKMSYDNSKSSNGKRLGFKGKVVVSINWLITKIPPLRRLGYSELYVLAVKQ